MREDRNVPSVSGPAAAQARKPFVRPAVQDLGPLTLLTLTTDIPVDP